MTELLGQTLTVLRGAFRGFQARVLAVDGGLVTAELAIFGRTTVVDLALDDIVDAPPPSYRPLAETLAAFESLYRERAPRCDPLLRLGRTTIDPAALHATLPLDYFVLYGWRDGMENPSDGWTSEYEADAWYELVPLLDHAHFTSVEGAAALIAMWREIRDEQQPCDWKDGFVPFVELQHYGLVVVDTVGYWGGQPGQIVPFDYKCANGYHVVAESLAAWWQTRLLQLERGGGLGIASRGEDIEIERRAQAAINGA